MALVALGSMLGACKGLFSRPGAEPAATQTGSEVGSAGFPLRLEPGQIITARPDAPLRISWHAASDAETFDIALNGAVRLDHHPASQVEIGFGERRLSFVEGPNSLQVTANGPTRSYSSERATFTVEPEGSIRSRRFDHEDDGPIGLTTPYRDAGLTVGARFAFGSGGKGARLWSDASSGSLAYKNLRQLPVETCWLRLAVRPEVWDDTGSDVHLARIRADDSGVTERVVWRTGVHLRSSSISGQVVLPAQRWSQVQLGVDSHGDVELWYFDGSREFLVGRGRNQGLAGKVKDVVSIGNDSDVSGTAYGVWLDEIAVGAQRLPWANEMVEHSLDRPTRLDPDDLPDRFSFVFGSCNVSSRIPYGNTALAAAAAVKSDFLLHLGDFGYADTGAYSQRAGGYLAFWSDLLYEQNLRELTKIPWIFVASDHDLGGNNVDSTTVLPAAVDAYSQWQNNDPAADGIGRYGSVTFDGGRVEMIWLDLISQRSPLDMPDSPDKTTLGTEQKNWLLGKLSNSPATLLIIASQGAIGHADVTAWHAYGTELRELLQLMAARTGFVRWLTGDHHSARIAEFPGNVVEWGAAPLAEVAQGAPEQSPLAVRSTIVTRRPVRGEEQGAAIRGDVLAELSENELNAATSFGRVSIDTVAKSATFEVLDSTGEVRIAPTGLKMQETIVYT